MKKQTKSAFQHKQSYLQTDIEDSVPFFGFKMGSFLKKFKKNHFRNKKKRTAHIFPEKVLRFRLKHLGKTLRVPCYNEESLNLPIRFTKKLNALEIDNDVQTDQEMVQGEVQRCCDWLKEAIRTEKQSSQTLK